MMKHHPPSELLNPINLGLSPPSNNKCGESIPEPSPNASSREANIKPLDHIAKRHNRYQWLRTLESSLPRKTPDSHK
jgi:hypothetical protein